MSINKGQLIREALQKYDKAKQEEGADLCRKCECNPEISKEMHDLLCDVLTDCNIADGMRAEITRVIKIWEEESK